MIKYRVNEPRSYRIYTGISEFDIENIVRKLRKELNAVYISPKTVAKKLNKDKELEMIAFENYKPDPIDNQWRDEIKKTHLEAATRKETPGWGYIPTEIIYSKIKEIIIEWNEKFKKEKILEEEAKKTGKPQILYQWIESCNDPKGECSTNIISVYIMPDG